MENSGDADAISSKFLGRGSWNVSAWHSNSVFRQQTVFQISHTICHFTESRGQLIGGKRNIYI